MATIVSTAGSTYRKAGARMLIDTSGNTFGLVSGGCLEAEIAKQSQSALRTGRPILLTFDTRAQLGCNGALKIFVESLRERGAEQLLSAAESFLRDRKPLIGTTIFEGGASAGVALGSYPIAADPELRSTDLSSLPKAILHDGRAAIDALHPLTRSYPCEDGNIHALFDPIHPAIQLHVLGAGPDTVPLCSLAAQLGWKVTLIVHPAQRPPEVSDDVSVSIAGPDEIGETLSFDHRTAVIVMTHNYGRDLAYLAKLIPLSLPYIGLLGPRQRRESLLADLIAADVPPIAAATGAFHSPVGLDIGADGPAEIALAILAEIKAVLAGRKGGFLHESLLPLHADRAKSLPVQSAMS